MGRLGLSLRSSTFILISISCLIALPGCGGGGNTAPVVMPAIVNISPASNVSLDIGLTQAFTAAAQSITGKALTVTFTFQSSNSSVVTIASNGLACAGTWDSLTAPVVCNPGPVGTAQITAQANGISSPPVTVYVHQHVDNIKIAPVTPPTENCVSKSLTFDYAATAYSRGIDVTSTVGPFTWQQTDSRVVTLLTTVSGLAINQVEATAGTPGITQIVASAAGVTSEPMPFTTCLVQSITLAISGGAGNSFTISSGSKTITPTIVDTLGTTLTDVSLTWSSSQPAVISVNTDGLATVSQPGSSTIIGSCTPPNCNIGAIPPLPLYPEGVINGTATGTTKAGTVWVTSTACKDAIGCVTSVDSINFPANTVATSATLPSTPNSFLFDPPGTNGYLGSAHGLMRLNPASSPPTVIQLHSVVGRVLNISPDGTKVLVYDDSSGILNVFDAVSNTGTGYPIAGVTAADFSPDSLKAYIVAGSTLYVYSVVDGFKYVPLDGPSPNVSFFPEGAFAYLAGGTPTPGLSVRRTCDNSLATDGSNPPVNQIISTPATPAYVRSLPNATQVLAIENPTIGIDVINVNGLEAAGLCTLAAPPLPPVPNISNGTATQINLGQGLFTPVQFLVSNDSNRAYVLTSNLASVLVYDVTSQGSSAVQLINNATPIQAALTPDNTLLYVVASDGLVHALNPSVGGDIGQVSLPISLCSDTSLACIPDLIAVHP